MTYHLISVKQGKINNEKKEKEQEKKYMWASV